MAQPEETPARREALIVAADAYEDPKLRALRAPARDAQELARVLGDPAVGDFRVGTSLNEPDHVVRRKLSEFFRNRSRDDLLLLHVACHGLKDEDGTLYFATSNTAVEHLEATAIPSEFVNRQMTKSRSRRIVLLLDCCFGGAFARGLVHRAGDNVAIKEEFEGQGRVVLTASRAMEYAFEGENREGDAQPSIFTSAIVQGLESGEADRDRDSRVSVDELYDYVYDQVREATPNQTPSKWTFDVHGDLYLARSPFREPEPVPLPVELTAAMESPFAYVRVGAVEELARLFTGPDAGLAAAARIALEKLADDDSKRVSEAAARALGEEAGPSPPEPVVLAPSGAEPVREERPAPTPPRPPRERTSSTTSLVALTLARASRRQDWLALAGAALIFYGYFKAAGWDTAWHFAKRRDEIWFFWSPVEAFGAALLVVSVVLASRRRLLGHEAADGLLLGVGLIVAVGMVAFVASVFEFAGTAKLTAVGAAGIFAAGALGLLTRRGREVEWPRRASMVAGAGAALGFLPLVVNLAVWEKSGLLESWPRAAYIEVLAAGVAAVLAVVALIRVPRMRLRAGGALIGLGTLLVLHYLGLMIQIDKYDGVDSLRLGGPLGIVGGLLLVVAGISVLLVERPVEVSAIVGAPAG
jgi:Caspase domain